MLPVCQCWKIIVSSTLSRLVVAEGGRVDLVPVTPPQLQVEVLAGSLLGEEMWVASSPHPTLKLLPHHGLIVALKSCDIVFLHVPL